MDHIVVRESLSLYSCPVYVAAASRSAVDEVKLFAFINDLGMGTRNIGIGENQVSIGQAAYRERSVVDHGFVLGGPIDHQQQHARCFARHSLLILTAQAMIRPANYGLTFERPI